MVKKFMEEEWQWLETIDTLEKTITEKDMLIKNLSQENLLI